MENYVDSGGTKIWTEITGEDNGKYIILCSGGPGCCDYLEPVAQMLDDSYSVIRFEQRGCGRSGKDGKYDIETVMSDIEAIREFYGVESWVVGGHSWGAILALLYSVKYTDRADALLFMAGIGANITRDWIEEWIANREKYGETLPEMPYPFNEEVNHAGNASFRKYTKAPLLYKSIANFKKPALFLHAADDIRPEWPVRQLQAIIEDSVYVTIPEAAHYIWLTHHDEMRSELRKFLGLPF